MPEETNGSFYRITNAQIYQTLQDVQKDLADAMRNQDAMLRDISENTKRIRSLELRFYGVLAGIVSAGALLVVQLLKAG